MDLLVNLQVPCVRASQLALIEPDLNA